MVHAGHAFAPGQVGVGLGRVREADHVQLLDFRPTLCPRHATSVTSFHNKPPLPLKADRTCCQLRGKQNQTKLLSYLYLLVFNSKYELLNTYFASLELPVLHIG